jgi:hypothetical protein
VNRGVSGDYSDWAACHAKAEARQAAEEQG